MWTILKRNSSKQLPGRFVLPNGASVLGELNLDENRTELRLRSDTPFRISDAEGCGIVGELDNGTQVSLFGCLVTGYRSRIWSSDECTSATLYAHNAFLGPAHIRPDEPIICSASFVIDDAHVVFHDRQAFGSVLAAGDLIEQVLAADKREKVETGLHPWVAYYTGKWGCIPLTKHNSA